jgi:hypothetical protein
VQTKLLGLYEPLVTNERRYVHEGWWTAAEDPKHLIQSRLARHLAGAKKEVTPNRTHHTHPTARAPPHTPNRTH